MKTVVLLSCCKKKSFSRTCAKDLYIGDSFKKSLVYALRITGEENIFILSAKYGVVELNDEIEPYDETLVNKSVKERRQWSEKVLKQLQLKGLDLTKDHFIILAGNKYIDYLIAGRKKPQLELNQIEHAELPLGGLPFGKRLQKLKNI